MDRWKFISIYLYYLHYHTVCMFIYDVKSNTCNLRFCNIQIEIVIEICCYLRLKFIRPINHSSLFRTNELVKLIANNTAGHPVVYNMSWAFSLSPNVSFNDTSQLNIVYFFLISSGSSSFLGSISSKCLHAVFEPIDPKSIKWHWGCDCLFVPLGSIE